MTGSLARAAYRYLVALFAAGVVAQFFLAGLGAFRTQRQAGRETVTNTRFEHDFSAHVTLGHLLLILGALVFLAALTARAGRRRVLTTLALPLLVALQSVLANAGPASVRALHVVNACIILALSFLLAHRAWTRECRRGLGSAG